MAESQILYYSGDGLKPEYSADLLGGKGYGLFKMVAAGIEVPPAFVISTEACREYMRNPEGVMARVREEVIPRIEAEFMPQFGYMPLVSVRSGAKFSMPGMMDTILNVGLDSKTLADWSDRLGKDCATNSYERLVEMYGSVVAGVERKKFEGLNLKKRLSLYKAEVGDDFPRAKDQLIGAIEAVFRSWNNDRAITYRKLNGIPDDLGTAVVVQVMVFGNMGETSCTGVLFSRDPSTGADEVVGEFLVNAQGEDVVAGIRTPEPLSKLVEWNSKIADQLATTVEKLEEMGRDMQDVEFTVQSGVLYILQTRAAKRTAQAAVRVAVDLLADGIIDVAEALKRVTLKQYLAAVRPVIDPEWKASNPAAGKGIPASNGTATGIAVFSSKDAVNCKEPCILIAEETTPDDIEGMNAAVGILTSTGGATSHAAVVARGMDKVCVVGCTELEADGEGGWQIEDENVIYPIKAGTKITLDGSTGEVWVGANVPIIGGGGGDAVKALVAAIEKKFGLYRTVTSPDDFNGAEKLLVATYLMDRRAGSLSEVSKAMIAALKAVDGREAVIDLTAYRSLVREDDAKLEYLFASGLDPAEIRNAKVGVLVGMKDEYPEAVKNVTVLGKGLIDENVKALTAAGYKIIPGVSTLSDLLNAEGLCQPDYTSLLENMSEEDVLRVVELKRKAGQALRSFNPVESVDPEAMNRGMVFALSPVQMAQSFLP